MSMSLTGMTDAASARSSMDEADLRAYQRDAENSRRALNGGAPVDKEKKLREACEGFEAMFIQKMWEGMRSSLPKDGLVSGGRDEKTWQGMYDQELGKSMAKSGGIGLADMMMTQLSRNLQNASDVAATSAARREPMAIDPVPLMPSKSAASPEAVKAAEATAAAKPLSTTAGLYGEEAVQPEAPPEAQVDVEAVSPDAVAKAQASAPETAVQSVLSEFASTVAPVANGTVANGTVANGTVANGTVAPPQVTAAPVTAAQTVSRTPQPIAPPLKRVRPPRDGMPRAPYRSARTPQAAPAEVGQANMTTGPNIANTRTSPVSGSSANAPAASATNLMKEQLS